MKSTFKLTLAIALCLGSSQALALQLGQIRVKSALDERLVAEIPIQLDNLGEAENLSVGLAPDADFARAGLSRAGLEQLRFSVVSDTTGHKIVLVTSEQPITDPYLDFLVQVNTAKGKQLREYTVLLDPVIASPVPQVSAAPTTAPVAQNAAPVAAPPQPQPQPQPTAAAPPPTVSTAPVQPAKPTASAPLQPPAPPARPVTPAAPAVPAAAPAQPRSSEYQVNKGDTLYHIATETRPDAGVSVNQMMLALQQANPDAFYQDNINRLKSGAILRIPTRDKVNATSVADARAQVRRQMEDWKGTAARKATTVVQNNPVPAAQAQPVQPKAAASDRLALVPPSQGGGSAASRPGEKGGTGTAEIAGLKQQLATTKESLTSLKQENGDLQSRVKDLEDISSNNKKLLDMKDAEIAELQRKLAEAQQKAANPAAAPAGNASSVATASSVAATPGSSASVASTATPASSTAVAASTTAVAPATSAAPATAKVAPAVQPAARPATQNLQNQGIAEPWYRKPLTWIIAGVVILGLILLGVVRRRPKPLPEPESDQAPETGYFGTAAVPEATEEPVDEYTEPVREAEPVAEEPAGEPQGTGEYHFNFDDLPPEEAPEATPEVAVPEPPLDSGSEDLTAQYGAADMASEPEEPSFQSEPEEPSFQSEPELEEEQDEDITREHPVPGFSDDPVDTKLDLARAYLDMGDPEGARAMLEEVLNEGSEMQKDEAKRLLEGVA